MANHEGVNGRYRSHTDADAAIEQVQKYVDTTAAVGAAHPRAVTIRSERTLVSVVNFVEDANPEWAAHSPRTFRPGDPAFTRDGRSVTVVGLWSHGGLAGMVKVVPDTYAEAANPADLRRPGEEPPMPA